MTRRLTATLFYSIDGIAPDPYKFQRDSFDAGLAQFIDESIEHVDDTILGRTSYTEWADYWPIVTDGPDARFAAFINHTRKHIASRHLTQDDLNWENSTLITGDLVEYVRALKETEGRDIAVQGSLSVVRQLVDAGLIDTLTLIIHPAIAGKGRGLFQGALPTRLKLHDVQTTELGNILITYSVVDATKPGNTFRSEE
ncbi:dihydrofolate reductase family protein [Corynebacterium anserum]|uniref:Dihydrofolate reductase n=1 Tax=Corynebacterium anserum TaxID=2684406 RepID=A0A7G7YLG8_9CORY|nr:dihydrofolate reductase family protein [Corynebacterium anserum]QNH95338.1 dihydrofolate reductase [Corynebacterium anserum]